MTDSAKPIRPPLRYTISCSGCREPMEIAPASMDDRIALCPHCKMPNPTPIYALLSGRRGTAST